MGIGVSIFLIAIGLILALAVDGDAVDFIDLSVVGWILVICGVLGLLVTLLIFTPRRRGVSSSVPGYPHNDNRPQY